jgi:imidazolonepropionase
MAMIPDRCDRIWRNARLVTLASAGGAFACVEDGILACTDGRIVYAGPRAEAPSGLDAAEIIDCEGRWITPGLIDCHTHLVYAGDRSAEMAQRFAGASYQEIARRGGGIRSTMRATRAASEEELVAQALPRLDALIAEGATLVEIKSGYGLRLEDELKQLRAAKALERVRDVDISPTFLGAHALPPEYADRDAYIDTVCEQMIPAVAAEGLADAVDIYCESIAFTREHMARVFAAAKRHGLGLRVHAEQFSNQHGAAHAAASGATSADHLEHLDAEGAQALAAAGAAAVLLPGAFYFTRETKLPPVALLREAGAPIALATDCNPGTSPLTSLLATMNMGAVLFDLTPMECIAGVTREAARALCRLHERGTLEAGKRCDLAIWDVEGPAELVFQLGRNPLHARVHGDR